MMHMEYNNVTDQTAFFMLSETVTSVTQGKDTNHMGRLKDRLSPVI